MVHKFAKSSTKKQPSWNEEPVLHTQNSEFDIGYIVNEINTADLLSNHSTSIEPKQLFQTSSQQLVTHKVYRQLSDSSLSNTSH